MARGDEAERIIGVVGQALWISTASEDLMLLRTSDRRIVICATIAKGNTTVGNDLLAKRLAMGHGSYVSTLVQRIRREKKEEKVLNRYERICKI